MRRAFLLLGVFVVIVLGAVVAGSMLALAGASRADAAGALGRAQSRALAWSGVQVIAWELSSARGAIFDGAAPDVTRFGEVYREASGRVGVFELVAVGDGSAVAAAENGLLDLNSAPEASLARLPGMTEALAAGVVALRAAGRIDRVERLLAVEGMTPSLLFGDLGEEAGAGARPVSAFVTVFSFEPEVRAGVSDADGAGEPRVVLGAAWSDTTESALSPLVSAAALSAMRDASPLTSRRALAEALTAAAVPVEEWGAAFDAVAFAEGAFAAGRLDINRATAEVLACLPGVDSATAEDIVAARASLGPDQLRSIAWPLERGLLTQEEFAVLADLVTTRSAQWRVRLAAGVREDVAAGAVFNDEALLSTLPEADEFGVMIEEASAGPVLLDRVEYEAVIDLAGPRPRIASLADVTLQAAVRRLSASARDDAGASVEAADDAGEEEEPGAVGDAAGPLFPESDAFAGPSAFEGAPAFPDGGAFGEPPDGSDAEAATPAGAPERLGRWTTSGGGGR